MLKLTYSKENININKLHGELGQLSDSYSLTHNDIEFNLMFPDLKKIETDILDEADNIIRTNVSYQKRLYQVVNEADEEGNVIEKQVETWEDYTTEAEALISSINQIIASHDPTPILQPPTTEEKVQQLQEENINLMLASAETYETMYQENVNLMLAVTELYEIIMNGGV
jgi:hypothetical protein